MVTCTHPAPRRYAWRTCDDTMAVACCDCGAVLTGGHTMNTTRKLRITDFVQRSHGPRETQPIAVGARGWLVKHSTVQRDWYELWPADMPPRTNSSHEIRKAGWLGQTNNIDRYALGFAEVTEINRSHVHLREVTELPS